MSAPRIVLGLRHQAGPDRVQVHVADQRQQIAIGIDQDRLVPPLKQVPDALAPSVDPAGVAERQVLHRPRQRQLAGLHHQMDVIAHQTEAVHPIAEAFAPLGQKLIEIASIRLGEEDVLPAIATKHDVVEPAGDMEPGLPRHPPRLAADRQ